ncbi:Hypothetical predicted protein [Mytilus galloprovincialis]|uniref:Uncharacterized protein n=1 Tax=Mytilus galloprovincialis TaxID=29158 RepID=A0A8B6DSB2_MYTGA|nr:Hypothetical predicted protein [Mytilus galloprovincialis]
MESVYINVGGTLFQTNLSTLQKYPDTLLGSLAISSEFYNKEHEQFYFDRNPELFNTVLDYYRNDVIHLPTHLCGWLWKSELEFWKIPLAHISECCFQIYVKYEKEATATKLRETFAQPDTFPNMLDGLWWSVVTMTTVGYDDMYPKGPLGRVVEAACAMIGILVIAMPIAVIAGNFDDLHKTNNDRESYNSVSEREESRKNRIN